MKRRMYSIAIASILLISVLSYLVNVYQRTCFAQSGIVTKVIVSNMPKCSIILITLGQNVVTNSNYIEVRIGSRKVNPKINVHGHFVKIVLDHWMFHGEYKLTLIISYTISSEQGTFVVNIDVGYLELRNIKLENNILSGDIVMYHGDSLIYPKNTVLELLYYPQLTIKSIIVVDGHFQLIVPPNVSSIQLYCHGGFAETMEGEPIIPMIVVHDVLTLKL